MDFDSLLALLAAAEAKCPAEEEAYAKWLYANGYVVRFPASPPVSRPGEPTLIPELAAANGGVAGWENGWRIEFVAADGGVVACRDSARRRFEPGMFLTLNGPGHKATVGEPIRVFSQVEAAGPRQTFYYAFGETVNPFGEFEDSLRLYWNVSAEGAVPLVGSVTREFNRFQLPFRFKCAHRQSGFNRLDAAVVYVHKYYWKIAAALTQRIHSEVAQWLAADVPMLTKPLSFGLALAEGPAGGGSFGQHRCGILARALMIIHKRGIADAPWRIEAIREAFAAAGLDCERPYLSAGSADRYDLS